MSIRVHSWLKFLSLFLLCTLFTLPSHAVLKTEIPIKFMKASLGINIGTHYLPEPQAGETPFEMFAFGWAPKGSSYNWTSSDPTVFSVDSPTEQRTKLTQIKAGVAKLLLSVMVTAPDGTLYIFTPENTVQFPVGTSQKKIAPVCLTVYDNFLFYPRLMGQGL